MQMQIYRCKSVILLFRVLYDMIQIILIIVCNTPSDVNATGSRVLYSNNNVIIIIRVVVSVNLY